MLTVIIICLISSIGLISLALIMPSIKIKNCEVSIYYLPPLICAIVLIVFGFTPINEVWGELIKDTAINPIKILVLFISMTLISVFLDEVGFFKFLANEVLRKAQTSAKTLFIYLYLTVSILTVFTSNDIIILTFTPFICYFSKNAKINPIPYLIAEFIGANTWSMALIIGNPTNIYLATSLNVDFIQYIQVMFLPTLLSGLGSLFVLLFIFRKQLKQEITPTETTVTIEDKGLLFIGILHISVCIILLITSSYIHVEMYLISLILFISLVLISSIYLTVKRKKYISVINTVKRTPFELIPFVLSMFVLVLALNKFGVTLKIAQFLGEKGQILKYGFTSFLTANLINNIPMSVLFSSMIEVGNLGYGAIFSSIIGSNLGAFLTPIGALAGIMWLGILKKQQVDFSFGKFIKYCFPISVTSLCLALLGLFIILL